MKTYDPACEELAEHFLLDEPTHAKGAGLVHAQRLRGLSLAIQEAIEVWLEDHPLLAVAMPPQKEAPPR